MPGGINNRSTVKPFFLHHTAPSGEVHLRVTWDTSLVRAEWRLLESAPEGTWVIEAGSLLSGTKVWVWPLDDTRTGLCGTLRELAEKVDTEKVYLMALHLTKHHRSKYQLINEDPFAV